MNKPVTHLFCLMILFSICSHACKVDECHTQCPLIRGPVVNTECECDCQLDNHVLVSGPVYHLCNFIHPKKTFALRLNDYQKLHCDEIDLAFLNVDLEYRPFTGFLPIPITNEDITEDAILFRFNLAHNGKFEILRDGFLAYAVTQNGRDRSELIIFDQIGIMGVSSPEEARPIYLRGCEDLKRPIRAKGYFSEELITLNLYFYVDEDSYFNSPDQYLFSEELNFDRQYSNRELGE